jgi:hypothetical protein
MPQPRPIEQGPGRGSGRFFQSLGIAEAAWTAPVAGLELGGWFLPPHSVDALDPERELACSAHVELHPCLANANLTGFRCDERPGSGTQASTASPTSSSRHR